MHLFSLPKIKNKMENKTLGGDRLGSGKKMQVGLHGYERSTHDLSRVFRSTMAAGTLVPFLTEIGLPGDTWDIGLEARVLTQPTVGPLFGSYKLQLDMFETPIRLYNANLHNNMLGVGLEMSKIKLPVIELTAKPIPANVMDVNTAQINPSCLLAYLGIRGVGNPGITEAVRQFNAIGVLTYWDIVKNYFANKQEKKGAVIHHVPEGAGPETIASFLAVDVTGTLYAVPEYPLNSNVVIAMGLGGVLNLDYTPTKPDPAQVFVHMQNAGVISLVDFSGGSITDKFPPPSGTIEVAYDYGRWGTDYIMSWQYITDSMSRKVEPRVVMFDLENIDTARTEILAYSSTAVPYEINAIGLAPYRYLVEEQFGIPNMLSSQEGLALKTYQSDIFNNWLESEYMAYVSTISSVSTAGGSFTIDQLNLSNKVYQLLNRIAVSGGTYEDWVSAVWAEEQMRKAETPMYKGGMSQEVIFQEVVSQSLSENQPLGTLAGKGRLAEGRKGGQIVIKCLEPSYIMGIASLTPRIDYAQGNKWHTDLRTLDDLHKPGLDQIGFQDAVTEAMAWWDVSWDGTKWVKKTAGKQPAWINYMTSYNEVYGGFAIEADSMFMTLVRRYERSSGTIADLTTYIDPSKYNFVFAQTSLDAQNFMVQIGMNITVRRKMSAKIMPNL